LKKERKNNLKDLSTACVTPAVTETDSERMNMNTMTLLEPKTSLRAAMCAPLAAAQNSVTPGPHTLRQAIQAAVDAIEDSQMQPFSPAADAPYARSRAVLRLLVEGYARQNYSSSEAAGVAARDPEFSWPWWEQLPDAHALRRFRRENHRAIHRCLMAALRFLAQQKISAGLLTKVDGQQLAEEARRRIITAAFTDSLELDGE
jgi:hypothetical protein